MQNLQRTFDDGGKSNLRIESAKSEVLKTVAYALLRQVYGVTEQQTPDVQQSINFCDESRRFEVNLIKQALLYAKGKQTTAARLLSLNATTLHAKIKLHGIEMPVEALALDRHPKNVARPKPGVGGITHVAEVRRMKRLANEESADRDYDASSDAQTLKIEVLKSIARTLEFEANDCTNVLDFDEKRGVKFYEEVRRFEVGLIKQALTYANGNQRAAARLLGLKTTTLNSKVKSYKLNIDSLAA